MRGFGFPFPSILEATVRYVGGGGTAGAGGTIPGGGGVTSDMLTYQSTLSGSLSVAQQTIVIGGADTAGTLSGNTLKTLIVDYQLINATSGGGAAVLTCIQKFNASTLSGIRCITSVQSPAPDAVHFKMYGGTAGTAMTLVRGIYRLRSGIIRSAELSVIALAENNTINETSIGSYIVTGGTSSTDITTITTDCAVASGLKAGSSWQVWSVDEA